MDLSEHAGCGGGGHAVGATINSVSHPAAYAWLARNCREGKGLPQEVVQEWEAGGAKRNRLLASFVKRVYTPGAAHGTNLLRLEAFIKIKNATKDFSKSLVGYEWKTESEMGSGEGGLKWSESLVIIVFHIDSWRNLHRNSFLGGDD